MIIKLDMTDEWTAGQVWRLQHAAYAVEAQLIGFPHIPPLMDTVATLQSTEEVFYGVREDGELVAAISTEEDGHDVTICRLMVHPGHFRQGLARALLNDAERRYPAAKQFHVSTGSANHPAIELYVSAGYEAVGRKEAAPGIGLTEFRKYNHLIG